MVIWIFFRSSFFFLLLLFWMPVNIFACFCLLCSDFTNWGAKVGLFFTGIATFIYAILGFFGLFGLEIGMSPENALLVPIVGYLWTIVLAIFAFIINLIVRFIEYIFGFWN